MWSLTVVGQRSADAGDVNGATKLKTTSFVLSAIGMISSAVVIGVIATLVVIRDTRGAGTATPTGVTAGVTTGKTTGLTAEVTTGVTAGGAGGGAEAWSSAAPRGVSMAATGQRHKQ